MKKILTTTIIFLLLFMFNICYAGDIERVGPDVDGIKMGIHMDQVNVHPNGTVAFIIELDDFRERTKELHGIEWRTENNRQYVRTTVFMMRDLDTNKLLKKEFLMDKAVWEEADTTMRLFLVYLQKNLQRYRQQGWNGDW